MKLGCRYLAGALTWSALLTSSSLVLAQTAPSLGSAQSFVVLAGSSVSNTGPSIVTGELGVSPGSAVTGFPPGTVMSGSIHTNDATAIAAQNSSSGAYTNLANQSCTQDLTGQNLGGQTLTSGVYCFSSSASLTGTLTLNSQGDPNAVFIFKVGSTLTTASNSSVSMINGGSLCNAYWQIGSSATLGTNTSFGGNILASTSITLTTGAGVTGRLLAQTGAVTLDSVVVDSTCAPPVVGSPIALSPLTLPQGIAGMPYSQTLTASGGTGPYTFSVTSGTLPAGLVMSTGGVFSGTPTTPGSSTFTVQGTDATDAFAAQSYTLLIAAAVPTLPQVFMLLLVLGLGAMGYSRLRQPRRKVASDTD